MTRTSIQSLCVLVVFALGATASAELIVYEGFDYPADGPIGGNNGGSGWDQPWTGGSAVLSPGLDYGELAVTGNTGAITVADDPTFRAMPSGFDALNRTIWMSFLAQEISPASYAGLSTFSSDGESLFIGSIWDTSPPRYWGVRIYNVLNDTGVETGPAFASAIETTEKVFFVVRIINGPSSAQMTLWLNPGLETEPDVGDAWFDATVGRIPFDRIRLNSWADDPIRYDYDEIRIGESYADVAPTGTERAANPSPADGHPDAVRQVTLSWDPGKLAVGHDVYLGTVFDDVNNASRSNPRGVLVSEGQDANTYDPVGLLEFSGTYYWRVDEIAADSTMTKGTVWQFDVEPVGYPIDGNLIQATASSSQGGSGPENTINRSGLDAEREHSTASQDMWQTELGAAGPAWIQYQFDRAYKLHELLVWNYNGDLEYLVGFGFREVTIEYSVDGETWTDLGNFTFTQGTSQLDYAANTTIDLGGALAQYVHLVAISSWGTSGGHGLSEVQFSYIPTWARDPSPASGAAGVGTDVVLTWRAGRDAASHDVYLNEDEQAVVTGTASVDTVTENQYVVSGLDLGVMYSWKINEVNETEPVTSWAGDVWHFTTQDSYVVEDFESYTDDEEAGEVIWQTWIDGYGVNDNGSQVGNDQLPYAERGIVYRGRQSMPLAYSNAGSATFSEATRTFDVPQDWTRGGAQVLVLYFYGLSDNTTGRLYLKINDTEVPYEGPASNLAEPSWTQWPIDLTTRDVSNVTKLSIGVDGASASGRLYVDEIRLYRVAP